MPEMPKMPEWPEMMSVKFFMTLTLDLKMLMVALVPGRH
jgi:hypothetical protein